MHYLRTFLPLQWDNVEQLLADAVAGGSNKRFVQFFLELRVRHRYRHKWAHLEAAVKGHGRPRPWVAVFKQQLFNWWRTIQLMRWVSHGHRGASCGMRGSTADVTFLWNNVLHMQRRKSGTTVRILTEWYGWTTGSRTASPQLPETATIAWIPP